jgi:protein arginine N-methyltransferase 5
MCFLFKSHDKLDDEEQQEDYLQQPLQPLMDNLESQTYEVFEKDVPKYNYYELALEKALLDFKSHGKFF